MKRLTESEIIEKFQAIEIEPLEINYQLAETYLPFGDLKARADLLVNIKWGPKIFRFVAEVKTIATPKLVENAISQLQTYLQFIKAREFNDRYYPMIVLLT